MSEAWNNVARQFLENIGFTCEPEPKWITEGKKPDFFCRGPLDLWIEVKSLFEEEDKQAKEIFSYFQTHAPEVLEEGRGMAYVATQATKRDAEAALKLAKYALSQPEARSHKEVWIVIPDKPDYVRRISFSVSTREGLVWFLSSKAKDGRYGYPFYLKPEPCDQMVEVISNDEPTVSRNLDSLVADNKSYRLSTQIYPGRKRLYRLPAEPAKQLTNIKRIRDDIKEAIRQLKNGACYQVAPGVVFVFQEGALVPDELNIFSALFGNLTFVFPPQSDPGAGQFAFGGNAAWHAKQNRTVSALTYFRNFTNGGLPCTIHNPYACRPIPHGIFGGREWIPQPGSDPIMFRLVEYPA